MTKTRAYATLCVTKDGSVVGEWTSDTPIRAGDDIFLPVEGGFKVWHAVSTDKNGFNIKVVVAPTDKFIASVVKPSESEVA